MSEASVSVILPVYNQEDHLAQIVDDYEEALGRMQNRHELILVLNACQDRSSKVAQALAAKYPSIRVLETEKSGWGLAIKMGLRQAQGDVICYTNSARTTGQDLVLALLYAVVYPNVVIKANRRIRENWRRRFGSLLYNLQCRSLFDLPTWDINGTPKVFPRKFRKLLDLQSDDDLIDAEFNVICRRAGYPVLELPMFSARRHGGKSTTTLRSAWRLYRGVFGLRRRLREANG
jgi:glycosyltransferase involved in cell wall biosynthesis